MSRRIGTVFTSTSKSFRSERSGVWRLVCDALHQPARISLVPRGIEQGGDTPRRRRTPRERHLVRPRIYGRARRKSSSSPLMMSSRVLGLRSHPYAFPARAAVARSAAQATMFVRGIQSDSVFIGSRRLMAKYTMVQGPTTTALRRRDGVRVVAARRARLRGATGSRPRSSRRARHWRPAFRRRSVNSAGTEMGPAVLGRGAPAHVPSSSASLQR